MRFEFLLDFSLFRSGGRVAFLLNNRQYPGSKKADGGGVEKLRRESKTETGVVIGVISQQGEAGENKEPE